jgi:hypothetical protein
LDRAIPDLWRPHKDLATFVVAALVLALASLLTRAMAAAADAVRRRAR